MEKKLPFFRLIKHVLAVSCIVPRSILFPLIIFICCIHYSFEAQYHYNQRPSFLKANSRWVFGNFSGLYFHTTTPTAFHTAIRTPHEATAIILTFLILPDKAVSRCKTTFSYFNKREFRETCLFKKDTYIGLGQV